MNILLLTYKAGKDNKYNLLDCIIRNMQIGLLHGKLTDSNLFIDLTKGVPIWPENDPNYPVTLMLLNIGKISNISYDGLNIKLK